MNVADRGYDDSKEIDHLLAVQNADWEKGNRRSVEELMSSCLVDTNASPQQFYNNQRMYLICNEVFLREQNGESPTLEEYQARFPELSEALRVQWEIDSILESSDPARELAEHSDGVIPCEDGLGHVGRYQLVRVLGRGSMGVVYEAYDPKLKRRLALKRLRPGYDASDPEGKRINTEAEAIAQLSHPNIVPLFDVGIEDGIPYLAMEYCRGGTLADYLNGQVMQARPASQLMIQIASGVAAAHGKGIVHRDLKPANVMLEDRELLHPKVSDFGMAKRLGVEGYDTATGSLIGSPAYMPPEQAVGAVKDIGPTADVYSLGAVLYECVTGRPPFRSSSLIETLNQVRDCEPIKVRQLEPSVPVDLETIIHKCLRKLPSQRYANANELAEDLGRFMNYLPIRARRESHFETAIRVFRKHPWTSALATVSALLLLAIAMGSIFYVVRVATLLRESQLGLSESLVRRAEGVRVSRKSGQRFEALAAISKAVEIGRKLNQPKEWFEKLRDEAIAASLLPDLQVKEWRLEPDVAFAADFSKDHQWMAVSYENDPHVRIRRMSSDVEVARIAKISNLTGLSFLGRELLFLWGVGNGNCQMWNVSNDKPRLIWQFDSGCNKYSISSDERLMTISDQHLIQVLRSADGKVLSSFATRPFWRDPYVVLHPTRPLLACCCYTEETVELRNWETGETLQILRPFPEISDDVLSGFTSVVWSQDGTRLTVIEGDGTQMCQYRLLPYEAKLELERVAEHMNSSFGGGVTAQSVPDSDILLLRGWSNQVEFFDNETLVPTFRSVNLRMLGSGHVPQILHADKKQKYIGFAKDINNNRLLGLVESAFPTEAKLIVPNVNLNYYNRLLESAGRFLVSTNKEHLLFADPKTGRSLLKWRLDGLHVHSIDIAGEGHLLMNGGSGCFLWPYRFIGPTGASLELGIPRRIHVPFGWAVTGACSNDGQTIVAGASDSYGTSEYAGFWIKSESEPAARKVLGGIAGSACAVSSDGKYVAGSHKDVTVWDCQSEILKVRDFPGSHTPRFHSDRGALLASNQLIRTEDWKSETTFPEGDLYCISPDGSLVVCVRADGVLVLCSSQSGKVLGRFEGLEPYFSPAFTAEGDAIIAWNSTGYIRIDLRCVRDGLKQLGLDWQTPQQTDSVAKNVFRSVESVVLAKELQAIHSMSELEELVDQRALHEAEANADDPQTTFDAAMVAIRRYDCPIALPLLDRCCAQLPDAITPRLWRAYLQAYMCRWSAALLDADWVLERIDDLDLRLLRAQWRLSDGRVADAIEDCTVVIEKSPIRKGIMYGLRAACYEASGQMERAEEDQAKFDQMMPLDASALNKIAEPMSGRDISLHHPTIALKIARRLQSLNHPLKDSIQSTVSAILCRNGLYDEAVRHLEKGVQDGSKSSDCLNLYLLAMCLSNQGKFDEARQTLARADRKKEELIYLINDDSLRIKSCIRATCAESHSKFKERFAMSLDERKSPPRIGFEPMQNNR